MPTSFEVFCMFEATKQNWLSKLPKPLDKDLEVLWSPSHKNTVGAKQCFNFTSHVFDVTEVGKRKSKVHFKQSNTKQKLDGSLPANPVNDRRIANAVTLKSTFCLP